MTRIRRSSGDRHTVVLVACAALALTVSAQAADLPLDRYAYPASPPRALQALPTSQERYYPPNPPAKAQLAPAPAAQQPPSRTAPDPELAAIRAELEHIKNSLRPAPQTIAPDAASSIDWASFLWRCFWLGSLALAVSFVWNFFDDIARAVKTFFQDSPGDGIVDITLKRDEPIDLGKVKDALAADLEEFMNPTKPASHYERQAERARALKRKLDAEAELAESIARRERARRNLNDQQGSEQ